MPSVGFELLLLLNLACISALQLALKKDAQSLFAN